MKILWVKAGGLVPLDVGGRIRSFHILRELARRHQITLFTFYPAQANDRHQELAKVFYRVVCQPLEIPSTRSFADYVGLRPSSFVAVPSLPGEVLPPRGSRESP